MKQGNTADAMFPCSVVAQVSRRSECLNDSIG